MAEIGTPYRPRGKRVWRLMLDGTHGAVWNMAVDEAILDAVAAGIAPPTVRMYGWDDTSVTVGKHQSVPASIHVEACRSAGIPIVRRPTGGRGVLHGGDLTVSVVVPIAHLGSAGPGVIASYRVLSSGIVAGLAKLDLVVAAGGCERRRDRGGDCFASTSAADTVLPGGEKLVGSAQCRRDGVILQQSSVRHVPPMIDPAEVFKGSIGVDVYPLQLRGTVELETALAAGFEEALDILLNPGSLTMWEEERASGLSASLLWQGEAVTSHAC